MYLNYLRSQSDALGPVPKYLHGQCTRTWDWGLSSWEEVLDRRCISMLFKLAARSISDSVVTPIPRSLTEEGKGPDWICNNNMLYLLTWLISLTCWSHPLINQHPSIPFLFCLPRPHERRTAYEGQTCFTDWDKFVPREEGWGGEMRKPFLGIRVSLAVELKHRRWKKLLKKED